MTLISDYYQKPGSSPFMNWYISFTSKHIKASRSVYCAVRTIYKTDLLNRLHPAPPETSCTERFSVRQTVQQTESTGTVQKGNTA